MTIGKQKAIPVSFFVIFLSASLAYGQAPAERVHAAFSSIAGDHAGLYVAQGFGLFRKYGLDTSFIYIAGAPRVIQAMLAGDIQIGVGGSSGVVDKDHQCVWAFSASSTAVIKSVLVPV